MTKINVTVSRGEFYRIVSMQYSSLSLPKSYYVKKGDLILIGCEDYKADVELDVLIVREVIEWDAVDFMDEQKEKYDCILYNRNYRS